MKQKLIMLIEAAVGLPAAAARWVRNWGQDIVLAANAFTPATHQKNITKFSAVAIATRYLLGKFHGTAANAALGQVITTTQGDRALFVIQDTVSATDLTNTSNFAPVGCIMLGVTDETVPMIANAALAVGTVVYPDTGGTVNSYAGAGSGTAFPCGVVVGQPSAQAGDIVEVASCIGFVASAV